VGEIRKKKSQKMGLTNGRTKKDIPGGRSGQGKGVLGEQEKGKLCRMELSKKRRGGWEVRESGGMESGGELHVLS